MSTAVATELHTVEMVLKPYRDQPRDRIERVVSRLNTISGVSVSPDEITRACEGKLATFSVQGLTPEVRRQLTSMFHRIGEWRPA